MTPKMKRQIALFNVRVCPCGRDHRSRWQKFLDWINR